MEIWKQLIDTKYYVSDYGYFKKMVRGKTVFIDGWIDNYGYKMISYYCNGIRKREFMHRLVASIFVSNNDTANNIVNHIDGNKINNHHSNLEWTNQKGNRIHAVNILHVGKCQRKINQLDLEGNILNTFNSIREASTHNNTLETSIGKVLRGKLKTHKNFIFEYCDNKHNELLALTGEIWKTITGYEKMYEVSNKGRVKSTHNANHIILKQQDKGDYLYVYLKKNNTQKNFRVHRLVAFEFIENPNSLTDVNHIDHNKKNNDITNLEWLSHKDNCNK
jgi:hypothetical protein